MGRRGPAPKPTALKLVGGNPGGRPLNTREPIPPPGEPDLPVFTDERARLVWQQLVPRLARIGLARSIDGHALERYCVLLVRWRDAAAFVDKNQPTYPVRAEGKDGRPGRIILVREFPQAAAERKLNQQLLALEREFGLTPAARSRINVETERGVKGDVNEIKRRFISSGGSAAEAAPPARAR